MRKVKKSKQFMNAETLQYVHCLDTFRGCKVNWTNTPERDPTIVFFLRRFPTGKTHVRMQMQPQRLFGALNGLWVGLTRAQSMNRAE